MQRQFRPLSFSKKSLPGLQGEAGSSLVRANNLGFAYGANPVLENVDLELLAGRVYGLCGENGSGKTTLAKILTGRLPGFSGRLIVPGSAASILVPQQLRWFSTVKLSEYLRAAGLDPRVPVQPPPGLDLPGSGEVVSNVDPQSLAWITAAAAFSGGRQLVVFDETSSYFSAAVRAAFWERVRDFTAGGGCVICIGHHLDELLENCDEIFAIRNNKVRRYRRGEIAALELTRLLFDSAVYATGFGALAEVSKKQAVEASRAAGATRSPAVLLDGQSLPPGTYHAVLGLRDQGLDALEQKLTSTRQTPGFGPLPLQANGFGYIPSNRQRDGLFPGLSVFENLVFHKRDSVPPDTIWKRELPADARPLMKSAVMERPNDSVDTLSSGMAQLLVIRRELGNGEAGVLAADPGQGLDHQKRFALAAEFAELASAGRIVLVLSQEFDEIASRARSWSIARKDSLSRIFTLEGLSASLGEDEIRVHLGSAVAGSDESIRILESAMAAYETKGGDR